MNRTYLVVFVSSLLIFVKSFSQEIPEPTISQYLQGNDSKNVLKGQVLDIDKHTALPYATIFVLHKNKGVVSNEQGFFNLDISDLDKLDTIRFQYIGYKTRDIPFDHFDTLMVVYLKEEIFNLSEILIFGSNPDPKAIVKKVLVNKASNYRTTTSKRQAFIRERDIQDIDEFKIKYKKSTIPKLDREMLALVQDKFPKNFTSFTDFLGDLYFNENPDDSVLFKIDPIRTVSLKEKDVADLDQLEAIFENVFANTNEDEYWKVKSGIFGDKIDMEEDEAINDSIMKIEEAKKDSLKKSERRLKYYTRNVKNQLRYTTLDDKNQWEFLYKTGNYHYTLAGGTRVNGEDVYIIDFTPKKSGKYIGRIFITTNTYALIRADYEYAPGKTGRDIHLLGIGYTETQFAGSIYFEKKTDNYVLKYFTNKTGFKASIDRNIALIKKRKRFFIDKKLKELKVGFFLSMIMDESFEYLVLDDQKISNEQFTGFGQKKSLEVIYVDQFDDKLWQGFSIIEPTRQMKEYKKQEVNFRTK